MYDPTIGRWLSRDPIGFEGGDSNLYRYVGNATTLATDPSGLIVVPPRSNVSFDFEFTPAPLPPYQSVHLRTTITIGLDTEVRRDYVGVLDPTDKFQRVERNGYLVPFSEIVRYLQIWSEAPRDWPRWIRDNATHQRGPSDQLAALPCPPLDFFSGLPHRDWHDGPPALLMAPGPGGRGRVSLPVISQPIVRSPRVPPVAGAPQLGRWRWTPRGQAPPPRPGGTSPAGDIGDLKRHLGEIRRQGATIAEAEQVWNDGMVQIQQRAAPLPVENIFAGTALGGWRVYTGRPLQPGQAAPVIGFNTQTGMIVSGQASQALMPHPTIPGQNLFLLEGHIGRGGMVVIFPP